jgi:hypothetical protein
VVSAGSVLSGASAQLLTITVTTAATASLVADAAKSTTYMQATSTDAALASAKIQQS